MSRIGEGIDLDGWVWPSWLDRQLDPESPAFAPEQPLPAARNVTARSWTALGNLDSALEATVDPRGLVTTLGGEGWSLDWWIGADDRWHLPSREPAVRQRLLESAPVVETAMRVPGGDVVHQTYAVRVGTDELVVVEVENRSPAPVALAFAIRPCSIRSLVGVRRIELVDDTTVVVDGQVALLLPRRPNRVAGSTGAQGDVSREVLEGDAAETFAAIDDPSGLATAAFIWPLPHRTSLRIALPLVRPGGPRRRLPARTPPARPGVDLPKLPTAEQVANGWKVHGRRGVRFTLPDDTLSSAVEALRRQLLVSADRETDSGLRAAVWLPGALDRFGLVDEATTHFRRLPEVLRTSGRLGDASAGVAGDGAVLHALAEHWRLHRDRALVAELAPTVAVVAEAIARASRPRRRAAGAERPGSVWWLAGLSAAGELLDAAGETRAADDARRQAASADLAFHRSADPDDLLAASWPLGLLRADDPRALTALAAAQPPLGAGTSDGAAVLAANGEGFDLLATIELAVIEVGAGHRRALDRLRWLLDTASPTWTLPTFVHPRLRSGSAGDGCDPVAAAGLLLLIRQLLVREMPDGLALVSQVPESWLGQGLEVHEAPTPHGLLSFAVRWHGDRPALLWEIAGRDGAHPPVLTAPGLDPGWSTTEAAGEALLAPVPVPAPATRVGLSPRRR